MTGDGDKTARCAVTVTEPIETVSISETVKVGQTLKANTTPEDSTVTYEWLKDDSAECDYSAIEGANQKTYQLKDSELGKFINVKVTGTGNFTGTQTSTSTTAVAAAATPAELGRRK